HHSDTLSERLLRHEAEGRRLKQELAQRSQHNNNNHPILHSSPPTAVTSAHISSSSSPFNPIHSSPNHQSISSSQFSSA
ncbi:unnamed protein product, partial [Rotaria magnacalcarata]